MKSPEIGGVSPEQNEVLEKLSEEEKSVLNGLLNELEKKPRELTPVETIFLKRQLDEINNFLSLDKPHNDPDESDDLIEKRQKISELLK